MQALLAARWEDVWRALGTLVETANITWEVGESPHFSSPRGFATTTYYGGSRVHLKFAKKSLELPKTNLDGILRHELGHVVDLIVPASQLSSWELPETVERRADAIAAAIWGQPIYYDDLLVQTTQPGAFPRPEGLGL